ncbi:MAG: poly-gamma-glutamate biosynthesis protein PgsC [Lutispora sp.]|nr:poly-gamma-glutamate biosynthesis protein PgsC [Lutispora sp.]
MLDSIIILGVISSIIFYEWTEISPGGIIVPGYMVLFLDNPKRILITVILSIITFAMVKLLSNYTILYGRRKFSIFIIMSFFLRYLMGLFFQIADLPIATALIIGYLVPGIIAQDIERQGALKTFSAMFIVTFLLKFAMIIYGV